jgi:thiamine-phosphate pyrophosphorylase
VRTLTGIYAIIDADSAPPLALAGAVLGAGVQLVQYRAKKGADRQLVRALHALTQAHDAILLVNDDLEAALEADGLHAGQEDLARLGAQRVRAKLAGKLLGVSCATSSEARAAAALGADYLGVGAFKATASKSDAGEAIGAEGVGAVARATTLPVAAIGGIELGDLERVVASGAKMAAVISAIARGPDPAANARALVLRWEALTR